ncbi:transcription repressor NadR [Planococcus beigongshangi]|uniref:transcription repressor NadR n=1 Tax=Planococcus beigongshangi TaxID=2782536 RepID=UPI00193BA30E|nr:transcription repressor NadR [Planococcus beigongshangi]
MKKILGEERRQLLLEKLKTAAEPLKGGELANLTGVSRQVIVGDMTLLKAKGEPIIATSQGYLYMRETGADDIFRVLACHHKPEDTQNELYLLVDAGVTVKDVTVEHPVYGELTAGIHVSSRREVDGFMQRIKETGASYLLELTGGLHLHTITAPNVAILEQAIKDMREAGYLMDESE